MSQYTPMTLKDMEQVLKPEKGWRVVHPSDQTESFFDFEVKALGKGAPTTKLGSQAPTKVIIRVYSSVVHGQLARACGTDAIRVCVLALMGEPGTAGTRGIHKFSRVYRTVGWASNLKDRVLEAYSWVKFNVQWCTECGKLMAVRQNKERHSLFWGCTGYPTCKATKVYKEQHL